MHLRDLLNMEIKDFELERKRIEYLFQGQEFRISSTSSKYTLKKYIASDFLKSPLRRTAISIDDFIRECSQEWEYPSLMALLFYCEMILNLLEIMKIDPWTNGSAITLRERILDNINLLLNKTGYAIDKGSDGIISIVKKDALASAVIEDVTETDVASAVLSYNRIEANGDIEGKQKLLFIIGKYVEPIIQRYKEFEGLKYDVTDDVRFGLNNLHVRHNNEEGKVAKPMLKQLSATKLESAYDDLYRSMLLLIELEKYPEAHERIKKLRKDINAA